MGQKLRNSILLLCAAAIWGFAFSFQQMGGEAMGPFTFNACRSLIGSISVLPVIKIAYGKLRPSRDTVTGGILCGLCLTAACNLQQVGILYTSPGKAGFVTASYMILVAVFSLFVGRKTEKIVLLAVLLGVTGLYLICVPDGEDLSINKGDLYCILCAVFFAIQIMIIDHYGDRVESVKMCSIQFLTVGILTTVLAFLFETPTAGQLREGLGALLYVGILSTGVAYSLQMVGMIGINPAVSSLIMSLESVFSVIGEWLILGTTLSGKALSGCAVMFAAILLSQMPAVRESLKKKT